MAVRRVDPDEAAALLDEGWVYLDVRSVAEYDEAHPPGAFNVPLLDFVPGRGLTPNTSFLPEVLENLGSETKVVVGCKSGVRSARAASLLVEAGFADVVDMRGGFYGEVDPDGRLSCAGWAPRGLPVATGHEPGRSYADLRRPKG